MYVVVCYDITSDRRRGRVLRKLRGYLTRVQKSVFEGPITREALQELRRMLLEEIHPPEDTVRIYHLCARCVPSTEVLGLGIFVDTEEVDDVL